MSGIPLEEFAFSPQDKVQHIILRSKREYMKFILLSTLLCTLFIAAPIKFHYTQWREYLGGPDRNHYSTLTQINPGNVHKLKVAWTYAAPDSGQMQMSPIIVRTGCCTV